MAQILPIRFQEHLQVRRSDKIRKNIAAAFLGQFLVCTNSANRSSTPPFKWILKGVCVEALNIDTGLVFTGLMMTCKNWTVRSYWCIPHCRSWITPQFAQLENVAVTENHRSICVMPQKQHCFDTSGHWVYAWIENSTLCSMTLSSNWVY